jgi:hypothetical protein
MKLPQKLVAKAAAFELGIGDESTGQKCSTLFPKITGNLKDLAKNYHHYIHSIATNLAEILPNSKVEARIPLISTVKLHGTHADLVIHSNDMVLIQSRNREQLTAELDNFDMYSTLMPL